MKKSRKVWQGAAAILMHDKQMLMIKTKKSQSWSIPSGGIEDGETPQQACIREVWEETGFRVQIIRPLHVKKAVIENYDVTTHYFLCQVVEGEIRYHDPDDEIEEIAWKTKPELKSLAHDYPEDLETLLSFFDRRSLEV